jgi:DNA-binding response OmpR family regulator
LVAVVGPPDRLQQFPMRYRLIHMRRVPVTQGASTRLRFGDLAIDFAARTVARGTTSIHLTPKELDVLRYLIEPGRPSHGRVVPAC